MKVHELIGKLNDLPLNSEVKVIVLDEVLRDPMPEAVWNDMEENYLTVL